MALLSRVIQRIFGETGGVDEFGEIGSRAAGTPQTTKNLTDIQSRAQYLLGWFSTTIRQTLPSSEQADLPASEDINSLFFLLTSQLAYIFQNGIPEWLNSADQRYYENISFVQLNGAIYQARLGNDTTEINSQQMPSETSIWWRLLWAPTADAFYRSIGSATTIDLAVQTPPKTIEITAGTPFTLTINNSIAPSGSPLMIHNSSAGVVALAGTSGLSGTIGVGQTLFSISDNNSMVQLSNQTTNTTDTPIFTAIDTGQGPVECYGMNQDVRTIDSPTFAAVNTGQGANELYAMDQNVRTTDDVSFNQVTVTTGISSATIDTGQGPVEAYAMDQSVLTTDTPTFAAIDTGQGPVECYGMNQDVRTIDSPTFASITSTGNITCTAIDTGEGPAECFGMNQDVRTIDPVIFSTVRQTTMGSRVLTVTTLTTLNQIYVIPSGKYIINISSVGAQYQVNDSTSTWINMGSISSTDNRTFFLETDGINQRIVNTTSNPTTISIISLT